MEKTKNALHKAYQNRDITDYDIFQNPLNEIKVEILAKNPSETEYKKIIEQIRDNTGKAIDYEFDKDSSTNWQTFYLYD